MTGEGLKEFWYQIPVWRRCFPYTIKQVSDTISCLKIQLSSNTSYLEIAYDFTDLGFSLNKTSTAHRHRSPAQAVNCASDLKLTEWRLQCTPFRLGVQSQPQSITCASD